MQNKNVSIFIAYDGFTLLLNIKNIPFDAYPLAQKIASTKPAKLLIFVP